MGKWIEDFVSNSQLLDAYNLACSIEDCYKQYNVSIKIRKRDYNPLCGDGFKFVVKNREGIRIESIKKLLEDVQFSLKLKNLRLIRSSDTLYLETFTSESVKCNNNFRDVLASNAYKKARSDDEIELVHPVGVALDGMPIIGDLAKYPHAVVIGTTRSGKSVALKCMLLSLLQYPPRKINLIIADRGAGLSAFEAVPHLSHPIIHTPEILATVFLLLQDEINRRTKLELSDKVSFEALPYIVCVIDEFPWFMDGIKDPLQFEEVKHAIEDIAQYGRHNRIHMILSIRDAKQNNAKIQLGDFPVRLVFRTVDSRKSIAALGIGGAEKLHGDGEMILQSKDGELRLKGFYIKDSEIPMAIRISKYCSIEGRDLVEPFSRGKYDFTISEEDIQKKKTVMIEPIAEVSSEQSSRRRTDRYSQKLAECTLWVLAQNEVAAISHIQNSCSVGYPYAVKFQSDWQKFGVLERTAVVPKSIEELSEDFRQFLNTHSVSDDKIVEALGKRKV